MTRKPQNRPKITQGEVGRPKTLTRRGYPSVFEKREYHDGLVVFLATDTSTYLDLMMLCFDRAKGTNAGFLLMPFERDNDIANIVRLFRFGHRTQPNPLYDY